MNLFDFDKTNRELLSFIDHSPNAYFAVEQMRQHLLKAGYRELTESDTWTIEKGHDYFVERAGSALIAFRIPNEQILGCRIMASHCDSPCFKIKPSPETEGAGSVVMLNTERYGGMIDSSWLDRPLSVAGRIIIDDVEQGGIRTSLVNIDRDLLMIPNLAIHMDRTLNDGHKYNPQTELLPLYGGQDAAGTFLAMLAKAAGVKEENILDYDMFLYNRMKGTTYGAQHEFIASGRLDDLQCAYASLQGLLSSHPSSHIAVHCVFDNEEVGSGSRQGAAGTFLKDVLERIFSCLDYDRQTQLRMLADTYIVSADNAHAVHPAHPEKADPTNRPRLNEGIVIKYHGGLKYTTDGVSGGLFRQICRKARVPVQTFANRSDQLGGSTLGHILQSQLSVCTVDIGLPQLSMHSAYETAGAKDTAYLIAAAKELFS